MFRAELERPEPRTPRVALGPHDLLPVRARWLAAKDALLEVPGSAAESASEGLQLRAAEVEEQVVARVPRDICVVLDAQ